ncbi:MAG: 2-amino-4-hydroxy-6-hydroxymethyldihydropteridine diphosphokinase [Muribaculum sp.]|nr:2-amino-4-hydroxy-6-hydroxymethyldihydropteridine diphosphokinase [Muribaculum sp.]
MNIAYLNIGTNQGHRQSNIDKAVALLRSDIPHSGLRLSDPVRSKPWGFDSSNDFLNIGVSLYTPLSPYQLLDALQSIEKKISPLSHRDTYGHYIDRTLDIDIIAMNRNDGTHYIINTPRLVLPHPHMLQREFVLKPMSQLASHWIHPVTGETPADSLRRLAAVDS